MAIEQGLAPQFDAFNIKMLGDPPHSAEQREPPRNALELDALNDEATAMDGAGWIATDIDGSLMVWGGPK